MASWTESIRRLLHAKINFMISIQWWFDSCGKRIICSNTAPAVEIVLEAISAGSSRLTKRKGSLTALLPMVVSEDELDGALTSTA